MATKVISFTEALAISAKSRRHLLLGNGFSIALFPDRFRYGSLLDEADFTNAEEARRAFDALNTVDFELVINALRQTSAILPLYSNDDSAKERMETHAEMLKEKLVQAIAGRHPARPSDISDEQYAACRAFLANFVGESRDERSDKGKDLRGNIYTFSYDLLLYWTLLHDQVVRWSDSDPLEVEAEDLEPLEHDDGFRAPPEDPSAEYVTWEAEGAADSQNIHFLHGALHLFDYGADLQKKCWERSGGIPLVDQIRSALNANKFPLFVSEGSSTSKLEKIRHSGYLQRSLKSFASMCRPRKGFGVSLFVYGHSFASNDEHVIALIERGKIAQLYIGLYGDPSADYNRAIVARANRMIATRPEQAPLEILYFDASTANVWAAS